MVRRQNHENVLWTARQFGLLGNLIVGVIGAFVGGLLFGLLGLGPTSPIGGLISAVVGAVVFVWLLRYLKRT